LSNSTTNTAQGLLADIIEHPESDDLRLIFADWLDDHGEEERAADIRWGVERGNIPVGDLTAILAIRRDHPELIQMFVPDGGLITDFLKWRRGFVAEVHAPLAVLQQHLPAIVREHPIERVRATDKEPRIYSAEVALWPEHCTWWIDTGMAEPDDIHESLARHLIADMPSFGDGGRGRNYPTAEAAHAALSDALLTLARR
jgi:uncharacterized protein (TIGR02996 family)